jgi:hypothetical protein
MAVAMGEEPGADSDGDTAEDEEFVADDKGWKNHEGKAAQGDCDAGGDAGDDRLQRGPEEGGQTKYE